MKIYLSYSRRDVRAADQVADTVRKAGHEVLIDRSELSPGADFAAAIEKMIGDSDLVVVLWSPISITSSWIMREAEIAIESNKYLGFVLGQVELPLSFMRIQHLQLTEYGGERHPGAIRDVLAGFDRRASSPRSANRTVRQATKRQSPYAETSQSYVPPPASTPTSAPEIDIPPFLRRAPEAPPSAAPTAPTTASASPLVANIAPDARATSDAPRLAPAVADHAERNYDIFISYSRKDTEACKLVFNLLAERGLVPWYDKDIGSGAFKTKIVTRISKASVFVLLLSRNSVGSQNVSKELSVASSSDRLIIPISIDGIAPDDLNDTFRYELIELNIFSADPKTPETWSDVVKTITDSVAEVRAEAGPNAVPVTPLALPAASMPLLSASSPPKVRRPLLFALVTWMSALLQQVAVGYVFWAEGGVGVPVAAALGLASGIAIWPAAYGAALMARLAFRPVQA